MDVANVISHSVIKENLCHTNDRLANLRDFFTQIGCTVLKF